MKNLLIFLSFAFLLVSCEDIQTHEFSMQAKIGDRLYTSTKTSVSIAENGNVIIEGSTWDETLTLHIARLKQGNFNMGERIRNSAVFEDRDGNIYRTDANATGLVTISEVNETNKTFSGTFSFSAVLQGIDTVYVSKGVLYNVSYESGW